MYCSKCGKEIPDNSTFCPYCKTKISSLPNKAQRVNSLYFNLTKAIFGITITCLSIIALIVILLSLTSANILSEQGDTVVVTTSVILFVISTFLEIAWIILLLIAKKKVKETSYFEQTKPIERAYFISAIYAIVSGIILIVIEIVYSVLPPQTDKEMMGYIIPMVILEIAMIGAMVWVAIVSGKSMTIIKKQISAHI